MSDHPTSEINCQHATATCCRGCISKWHRIEKGRALDEKETGFILVLIMGWIVNLLDEGLDVSVM